MKFSPFKFLSLTFFLTLYAIGSKGQQKGNYLVLEKGDTIPVKSELTTDSKNITYTDMQGAKQTIDAAQIKYMVTNGHHYKMLPVFLLSLNKLQEIVATNKSFVLTVYYDDDMAYLYIWNRHFDNREKRIYIGNRPPQQVATIEKYIKKYFLKCPKLLDIFKDNLKANKPFNEGVMNYDCAGTAE